MLPRMAASPRKMGSRHAIESLPTGTIYSWLSPGILVKSSFFASRHIFGTWNQEMTLSPSSSHPVAIGAHFPHGIAASYSRLALILTAGTLEFASDRGFGA